jgi:glycine/D-amino acid oxidase-like deaminating enzyme
VARPIQHSVVVVGAGPVGLSTAIDLAQQNLQVLLLDDDDRLSTGSRAICLAKRTHEILHRPGKRRAEMIHLDRSQTAGNFVARAPDAQVMFAGDGAEYKSACYSGDAHLRNWPTTLKRIAAFEPIAIVLETGAALTSRAKVQAGLDLAGQFRSTISGLTTRQVKSG